MDTVVQVILFSRRGSHCSARGGVAAQDTSCMHGTKKKVKSRFLSATRIKKCLRKPWIFYFYFFQAPLRI